MKVLIEKIKALRNNGLNPCDESIDFLRSCETPQEALEKATWGYLEWLLDALKVDFKKEQADYYSNLAVLDYEYWQKFQVIHSDYGSKSEVLDTEYANSLRKLVPASFFS